MKLTELMRDIAVPAFDTEIQGITCDSRRVRRAGPSSASAEPPQTGIASPVRRKRTAPP